jgi:hypothetical protein
MCLFRPVTLWTRRIHYIRLFHTYVFPFNVESHLPVFTFQIFTVVSQLPLVKDAPPGLQATDETLRFDEMSQHAKQLDERRKLDKTEKKKSHGYEWVDIKKKLAECPFRIDQKKNS